MLLTLSRLGSLQLNISLNPTPLAPPVEHTGVSSGHGEKAGKAEQKRVKWTERTSKLTTLINEVRCKQFQVI
jgi:hypothetical protein